MKYINSIVEAIGDTPLLKLNHIGADVDANIFVKLEHLNPSGSYKDRMAVSMIEAAEEGKTWNGRKLEPKGTVLEASAGNTAAAVAMVCAAKGYRAKFVLYRYQLENGKNSRIKIVRAFGPDVECSSDPVTYLTEEQMEAFVAREPDLPHVLAAKMDCQLMEDADDNSVWIDQIYNPYNYLGQKKMAYEIYDQLDGKIDVIGCSVGAGGTLYGLCLGLKDKGLRPELIFGVVPNGSERYLDFSKEENDYGEFSASHMKTELAEAMGLKKWVDNPSIVAEMIDAGYPDKFFCVSNEEAREMANRLCQEEGIYCGMSSGANVAIALRLAKRLGGNKNIVTTIVDRRDRYLSEMPNERYVV